jgi:hypothetical protein
MENNQHEMQEAPQREADELNAIKGLDVEALSDEDLEALEEAAAVAEARLEEMREALGKVLIKHRDAAITYRNNSGIEQQWAEDQAYYEGQDETSKTRYYKGTSQDSPLIAKPKNNFRSKVFLNITRAYCEAAASKVIEVLTPTDTPPWSIEPSSIPNLPEKPSPLVASIAPQAAQSPAQLTPLEEALKTARAACKGAELWIKDKLDACDFTASSRTIIDEAARLGTGVIRGPLPTMRRTSKTGDNGEMIILEEIIPESRHISVWDCFPDPACGDNIHDGQFFVEHDRMVEKQVQDLKEQPGYITSAIDSVLEAGPMSGASVGMTHLPHESQDQSAAKYHIWYYYGFLKRDDVIAMKCVCGEGDEIANVGVPVVITMINNTPVKAHLNPLADGYFPYEFTCWQRVAGSPFGIGIARQIRSCQAILNANVRALMENAGLSSGPQILIARGAITPADGNWTITPRKVWLLKADSDVQDVSQAMSAFQIPSIQNELLQSIDFALKMAENVTGLPILMQGQQGQQGVPETVGGMQILMANASSLLRRMARIYDDCLIKPHIQAYYRWMMDYADDKSIKGDFKVVAHGSSALVTRDQRNQFMLQTAPQMMANPGYGIDPTRLFKEIAKIAGMQNPEDIMFTAEEMAALQAAQAQIPDVKLQVAQVAADAKLQAATIKNETDQVRIATDRDRDTVYVEAETQRTQISAAIKVQEMQLKRELLILELAHRDKLSIDTIKAQLAMTASGHDFERELATMPTVKEVADSVSIPAIEPVGKAPDGYSDSL